jgi:hypothetical protein
MENLYPAARDRLLLWQPHIYFETYCTILVANNEVGARKTIKKKCYAARYKCSSLYQK